MIVSVLLFSISIAQPQNAPQCATVDACRVETREAIAARDYERAHDLAWLAFQKGGKDDPETLRLLARVQSLSGRWDDAFVMLRRLAERGMAPDDVRESDDFRRVRDHARWPELLALLERAETTAAATAPATPPTSPSGADRSAAPGTAIAKKEAERSNLLLTSRPPRTRIAALKPPAAARPPAVVIPAATSAPTTPPMEITEADAKAVGDELTLPRSVGKPAAIAYDSVSARFVVGYSGTDALTVLSQTSTNAAAFTSRGWSGGLETTAASIDRQSGDLWVAVRTDEGSALHRLQLISGRRLELVEVPGDPAAELTALVVTSDGLLALDRSGRRLFRRPRQGTTLQVAVTLPEDVVAHSLTGARGVLYVAHANGIRRIDSANRRQQDVTAADASVLAGWHSIAVHDGVLLGIQQHADGLRVLRAQLNGAGTRITRVETLGAAASTTATLADGVYYFFPSESVEGVRLRGIAVR